MTRGDTYRKDHTTIDAALLSPRQAARIYAMLDEEVRFYFMNTIDQASHDLHDLTMAALVKYADARPVTPPGQAADRSAPPRGGRGDAHMHAGRDGGAD